jgi:hemin uptake protein HemP
MNSPTPTTSAAKAPTPPAAPLRLNSHDLLQQAKAVQIEHDGKIYELRVTRLNKLILTA